MTIWSMFGAVDWNSLLTQSTNFYEPGAFDTRGISARETALAHAAASLAQYGTFEHPAIDGIGWWERRDRFFHPPQCEDRLSPHEEHRPILIIGNGRLGRALAAACEMRSLSYRVTPHDPRDEKAICKLDGVIDQVKPWAIVNCCGFSAASCAHSEPERCFAHNVLSARMLASRAAALGLPYVMISTDMVFDGAHGGAYVEPDLTRPLGIFGTTKRDAELQVVEIHSEALILRTGPLFGPTSREMLAAALRHAARDAGVSLNHDLIISPTYIPDLADALLDLLIDSETGIWHLANAGAIDAEELFQRVIGTRLHHFAQQGRSGCNLALSSQRGILLPKLGSALERFSTAA